MQLAARPKAEVFAKLTLLDRLFKRMRKISFPQLRKPSFIYLNFQEQLMNGNRSPESTLSWTTRLSSCSLVSYQVCL